MIERRVCAILLIWMFAGVEGFSAERIKIPGYKGIWFTLEQYSVYGDKYSGGLATYTAKHIPLAVYAAAVNKTFFVYGGTLDRTSRHLLAMISYYDHTTRLVPQPRVVHDKGGVNDPHDNPSISMDDHGHLWVFVSGRGRHRPGFIYRSQKPYDIDSFELVQEREFAYPQPWWSAGKGFLWCFTKYTMGRELYCAASADGLSWTEDKKLVQGGHYQVTNMQGNRLITAFDLHPHHTYVDGRTNLYVLQTTDMGQTWQTIAGRTVTTPLADYDTTALVRDYCAEGRLVYLKDIVFDENGHPVILYITSNHFAPGPKGGFRFWETAAWTGAQWDFQRIALATHNYDMGSLYVEADGWKLIAPTAAGPQWYGSGGEVEVWVCRDRKHWSRARTVTQKSERNHGFVRRPVNAHPDFYAFWADGDPHALSISRLYFTNQQGDQVWELPYDMTQELQHPLPVK